MAHLSGHRGSRAFRFRRGLDVPIDGAPEQAVSDGPAITSVALLGRDYPGLRPLMRVEVGDRVALGQALFADRKRPEILFTAPGSGIVTAINRGPRRSLQSVVIALDGTDERRFDACPSSGLARLEQQAVAATLLASGNWTAFRARPFGRVPDPGSVPRSLFVTAMDTNPLAADPAAIIAARRDDFVDGLAAISRLTDGPVHVCHAPGAEIPLDGGGRCSAASFAGPHPAGLPGTHIHRLDPVGAGGTVWHIGYQDVIAIGRLFTTGRLSTERIVALGGPLARRPRLLRTRLGASTAELTRGETAEIPARVISGSVLSGHRAADALAYLGRYHTQVAVIAEGWRERHPAGRRRPAIAAFLDALLARHRRERASTALNGRPTTMLPLEVYDRVMPLDILAVPLLRALLVGDVERAQELGCLEFDEEDVALWSFVCPSKIDYGALLRGVLTRLEAEAA